MSTRRFRTGTDPAAARPEGADLLVDDLRAFFRPLRPTREPG